MKHRYVEVSDKVNWGKFQVSMFDEADLAHCSKVSGEPLLSSVAGRRRQSTGDAKDKVHILDLQTEEGALFLPGKDRDAKADLDRHAIWVCPLFLPFITWLYARWPLALEDIPDPIELEEKPLCDVQLQGYRRPGEAMLEVAKLRGKLTGLLAEANALPSTLVQVVGFFYNHMTDEEKLLLGLYRDSLSTQEWNRWLGSLLIESGRYKTALVGNNQIGLVPVQGGMR